jgi:hypothetical protein
MLLDVNECVRKRNLVSGFRRRRANRDFLPLSYSLLQEGTARGGNEDKKMQGKEGARKVRGKGKDKG